MAKIKAKKNEELLDKKGKKIKKEKIKKEKPELSDTEETIRSFIILLIIILVVIGITYYFTNLGNNKNTNNTTNEITIQYDDISVGMILNRNEYKEYYVLAYFDDGTNAYEIENLIKEYSGDRLNTKLFTVDLNDPINKDFVTTDNAKLNVTSADELLFKTDTLLHIKDGKIIKTYTDFSSIEKNLK